MDYIISRNKKYYAINFTWVASEGQGTFQKDVKQATRFKQNELSVAQTIVRQYVGSVIKSLAEVN